MSSEFPTLRGEEEAAGVAEEEDGAASGSLPAIAGEEEAGAVPLEALAVTSFLVMGSKMGITFFLAAGAGC